MATEPWQIWAAGSSAGLFVVEVMRTWKDFVRAVTGLGCVP